MQDSESVHLHLDAVGGIAGDMFVAALLDANPHVEKALFEAMHTAGLTRLVQVARHNHDDGILTGSRISVEPAEEDALASRLFVTPASSSLTPVQNHDHDHDAGHGAHTHRAWRDIRKLLEGATLPEGARSRAIAIFAVLAEAEASVHGKSTDDVEFHEVGAWDSIADIVMAAWLIDQLNIKSVSASALPRGNGLVETAHGRLPVPAPATALLLKDMPLIDDGLQGERITPTGAAILKHLQPTFTADSTERRLKATGHGFGTKRFPGISNVLRAVMYATTGNANVAIQRDRVITLSFEVDDQTPEDLATGLDNLRDMPEVIDVVQSTVSGKKGRLSMRVEVLAKQDALHTVQSACFLETTTLGIRWQMVERGILKRHESQTERDGHPMNLKHALRPDGTTTSKVDMDDLRHSGSHSRRQRMRKDVEN